MLKVGSGLDLVNRRRSGNHFRSFFGLLFFKSVLLSFVKQIFFKAIFYETAVFYETFFSLRLSFTKHLPESLSIEEQRHDFGHVKAPPERDMSKTI